MIQNTIDGMSIINLDGPIQFLTLLGQAAVEPAIELLQKDTDELRQAGSYILGEVKDFAICLLFTHGLLTRVMP